jgi:hypothetical protein
MNSLCSLLCFNFTFDLKGAASFWKGAVPTAMGMVLENAMAFGVNEALKRTFPDDAKEDPTQRPDLVKPFMMVSLLFVLSHMSVSVLTAFYVSFVREQSLDAVLQLVRKTAVSNDLQISVNSDITHSSIQFLFQVKLLRPKHK